MRSLNCPDPSMNPVKGWPDESGLRWAQARHRARPGTPHLSRLGLPLIGAMSLGMLMVLGGCQSATQAEFDQAIQQSAVAISAADLTLAREKLEQARHHAPTDAERIKVDSLSKLVDGAEAYMAGDVNAAATAWSQIQDATLRVQVYQQAKAAGLHIEPKSTSMAQGGR